MLRFATTFLALLVFAVPAVAQEDPQPPVPVDKTERAEVRLVLLDTVVVDRDGEPVAGLTAADFEIRTAGEALTPAVFETRCDETPAEQQPLVAKDEPQPEPRRIVLAFDYLHLPMMLRESSLDSAMEMVRDGITEGDEVMVAALTGGLRIEQPFSADADEVLASLRRMQKDVSLWSGNFSHSSETGFVRGMTSLFDVLAEVSTGPKAVVFYSASADAPLDLEYETIASRAAAARCALYTVDPRGLEASAYEISESRFAEMDWLPGGG